jgi:hypothetical protein
MSTARIDGLVTQDGVVGAGPPLLMLSPGSGLERASVTQ